MKYEFDVNFSFDKDCTALTTVRVRAESTDEVFEKLKTILKINTDEYFYIDAFDHENMESVMSFSYLGENDNYNFEELRKNLNALFTPKSH